MLTERETVRSSGNDKVVGSSMSEQSFEKVKKGVVKRKTRRVVGVFIDGTSLDRATRRMQKRVDMPKLVRGVAAGATPAVARYYTVIPHEDDSRQRAFLDAVRNAGLQVIVKRLPPKGITRQVTIETEMASDIMAFGLGKNSFENIGYDLGSDDVQEPEPARRDNRRAQMPFKRGEQQSAPRIEAPQSRLVRPHESSSEGQQEQRIVTVVCPGRDLSYPFLLLRSANIQTVSADFGQPSGRELIKSAAKWIDLSDSETIWRDE